MKSGTRRNEYEIIISEQNVHESVNWWKNKSVTKSIQLKNIGIFFLLNMKIAHNPVYAPQHRFYVNVLVQLYMYIVYMFLSFQNWCITVQ